MGVSVANYIFKLLGQICTGCAIFTLSWIAVPFLAKKSINGDKPIKLKAILFIIFVILSILFGMIRF